MLHFCLPFHVRCWISIILSDLMIIGSAKVPSCATASEDKPWSGGYSHQKKKMKVRQKK